MFGFALFPLVDTGNFWLIVLGITGGLVFLGLMYGPQAAFFTELFSTEVRIPGASSGLSDRCDPGWSFCADYRHHSVDGIRYILGISVYCLCLCLALISVMMLTETYQTNLNEASYGESGLDIKDCNNTSDFRRLAKTAAGAVVHYIDGGADDEVTLRRNTEAFDQVRLIPDALADLSNMDCVPRCWGSKLTGPSSVHRPQ